MKRELITAEPHGPALIGRRTFIGGTIAATVAATAMGQGRDYGQGAAPVRYPDPDIIVLEPRFARYKLGNAAIQRLYTGMLWAEGPLGMA